MVSTRAAITLVCFGILAGCATQKPGGGTSGGGKYSEDLSALRPKVTSPADSARAAQPTDKPTKKPMTEARHTVNKPLDTVLDSINTYHVKRKYVDGYTIQVFTGDKEGALSAKRRLTMALPDLESEIKFDPPTFRVKVGEYLQPLDAQKDFVAIKKHFSSAILVPHKVAIN